jgi:hypothetical protein
MLKNPELRQRYGPAFRSTGIGGIALLASKRHRRQQTQSALPDSHFASRINWQRGAEGTTRPIVGNSLESPAMCLGDRGANGQTHADALRLCRVEHLKNSAQMLGVHAHTGIRKGTTILPECCCSVRIRKIRARVPASRMASMAFMMRFSITCCSRTRSTTIGVSITPRGITIKIAIDLLRLNLSGW